MKNLTNKLEILHKIILAANEATDLDSLLRAVLNSVLEQIGLDGGGIYLVDQARKVAELRCALGLHEDFIEEVREVPISGAPYEQVFIKEKPLFVDGTETSVPERYQRYGIIAAASIPFIAKGKVVGSLNVSKNSPHLFTDEERDILNSIGRETAAAIVRMQSEMALRQSELKYKELTDSLPESIFEADLEGAVMFANSAARALFGLAAGETGPKPNLFSMLAPGDVERARENLKRIIGGERSGPIEYTLMRIDGTPVPVVLSATPVARDGAVTGFRGILVDMTRQKKAEQAVIRERDFSVRLIQAMPAFFIMITPDGKILFMNESMLQAVGYKPHEIFGMDYLSLFVPPEEREMLAGIFSTLVKSREHTVNENHVLARDGRKILVEWYGRPIFNQAGEVEYFFGIGVDIDERKRAVEALRDSEAKFRAVAETSGSAIYIWQDNQFVYVNPAAERITGYSREEILEGKIIYEALHPDFREFMLRRTSARLGGDRQPIRYEVRIITKGGEEKWVDLSATIMDYRNRPAVIGTAFDITKRKRAEEELAAEKERLAVTLYSIGEGVITTDTRGRVSLINRIAEDLTGWPGETAAGRPLHEIFYILHEKTGQPLESPHNTVFARKEMPDTALLLSRDGRRHVIAQSASPIKDSHGTIAGMVLVFRDISEGRKMEEELLKARNLESLSILAGGIAHDFNNILTVIIGNISLAKMGIESGTRAHGLLGEAEKASWRARDLTQQLLTFSKGGAPVKKITSISELLKDTVSFTLSGSNIRCTFLLPEDLWPAEVDAGQVSQVINNLVINAQQAMPAGGTIEIAAENAHLPPVRKPGRREPAAPSRTRRRFIKIKLADHGIGIPSEHLPKIFDPYFTTKQRGSGLGLTTAYSIVNKHGGHITVESEVGKGTSITVFLPATAERPRPKEKKAYKITPHKGRILLVDDEEPILDLGARVIGSLGYEVELARGGEEAVEIYRKARGTSRPFDAVIMDLTIPGGMGGKETLVRLREVDPTVRAVVSSGYSNDPIMSGYRSHGFRGVIAKPYTIDDVARTLRSVLGRKGKRKTT